MQTKAPMFYELFKDRGELKRHFKGYTILLEKC